MRLAIIALAALAACAPELAPAAPAADAGSVAGRFADGGMPGSPDSGLSNPIMAADSGVGGTDAGGAPSDAGEPTVADGGGTSDGGTVVDCDPSRIPDGGTSGTATATWTSLPPVDAVGGALAIGFDNEGAPLLAVRRNNGRSFTTTTYLGPIVVPATSIYVVRFDGRAWVALGSALDGTADEVYGGNARLLTDGCATVIVWDELDGNDNAPRSSVHASRWNGTTWQAFPSVNATPNACLDDAHFLGPTLSVLWYNYEAPDNNSSLTLSRWNGAAWEGQFISPPEARIGIAPWLTSMGLAPNGALVFAPGQQLLTAPVASGASLLFRVVNDGSFTFATLERWSSGGWTQVATVYAADVLLPNSLFLSPAVAVDGAGGAVVSWLAAPDSSRYPVPPTSALVGRWSPGGFTALGTFPETGALTIEDRALLSFDRQDNLYVTTRVDADLNVIVYRYGN